MRLRLPLRAHVTLLAVFCLSCDLSAQTTSGSLTGTITDQTKAAVVNAEVEIKDRQKGTLQSTKTDREGVYRFFFVPPSNYLLTVGHEGFRKARRSVDVRLGPPVTLNIALEIETASTEVTVADEVPLIQAENGDASSTINQKQVSEVPNPGNDLTYIVQTAPGVIMNTDSQSTGGVQNGVPNFSILGMPGTSYQVTLDGMSITENGNNFVPTGSLGLVLGQNQIQETTVVTTGYSGPFGQAAGGNITYVSKSGSNPFHGNAQYYWNGRILNANDWFANATQTPRPFSVANQWAGSFGGAARKDKLFFFIDTEGLRLLIPQFFQVVVPSPQFQQATIANIDSSYPRLTTTSQTFYNRLFSVYNESAGTNMVIRGSPNPADPLGCNGFTDLGPNIPCSDYFFKSRGRSSQDTLTSGRLDWNVGQRDRVFVRIQREQGLGAFYTDPINSIFDANYNVSLWQGQLVETHTFDSTAANQFLVAGLEHSFIWGPAHYTEAFAALPTALNFAVTNAFTNVGTFWTGEYGTDRSQFQMSDDLVKTRGKQKWGLGFSVERIHWNVPPNKGNSLGTLYPQSLRAFYEGGEDPGSPGTDFTLLTQSFTSQSTIPLSFTNFAAYAQGEWHASSGLALTFALRAEHYSNPFCESRCFSRPGVPFESLNHDPSEPYNQAVMRNQDHALLGVDSIVWSPRFSFAWQPFGVSHNSILRGGVGIFYDPLRVAISETFYLNTPNFNVFNAFSGNLAPDERQSLFNTTSESNDAFVSGFSSGSTLADLKANVPNFVPPALTVSERRMHLPQYQRWSLEWQQAFGAHTSASIGYFGHHGIHEMYFDPSANAFGFGSLPPAPCTSNPIPPCSDPRFAEVTEIHSAAVSNYHGMVASLRHQLSSLGSGLVQINYTFSHAFDEVSNAGIFAFTSGSSTTPQDPGNLRGAYGPAEYDVRHSLNASYVWEVPLKAALGGHGPDVLVKGWQIAGTVFARTGFPYTVFDRAKSGSLQQQNYFGQIYAVPVGPLPPTGPCGERAAFTNPVQPCMPPQFFEMNDGSTQPNPRALFVQANCETGFNSGTLPGAAGPCSGPTVSFAQRRNRFRGPGYFSTDLSIMKNTRLPRWEKATLGIGFQFFNLFNHPNFGFPDNSTDSTFGQIFYLQQPPTSVLGSGVGGDAAPRMIQVKAELRF